MIISDHLNLTARSPLVGANFVDLTTLYSPRLRALAAELDPTLIDGVYAALPGPHYETPAEIRMLRTLGATWSACRRRWRRSPRVPPASRSSGCRW